MNNCKNCNKNIPENKKYCNVECMGNDYRKTQVEITCIICGVKKHKPISQSTYKFCSQKCYHISKNGIKRPEHSKNMTGKKFPNRKLSESHRENLRGENSSRWKGGITSLYHKIRRLAEYSYWRMEVYKRDKYTCQMCFIENKRIECHHIKTFSSIIHKNNITSSQDAIQCGDLWDIDNGLTLCVECHKKTDSYGKN